MDKKEYKLCQHVRFPNHPHESRRKPCKAVLLKKVRAKQGYILSPIKVYPYKPLKSPLNSLLRGRNLFQFARNGELDLFLIGISVMFMMD